MYRYITVFCSLLLAMYVFMPNAAHAQGVWEDETEIYRNGSLIIKITFNYSTNSCTGGKQHKFRYIAEGPVGQNNSTINFTFDYKNCEGNPVTFHGTLNLADIKQVGNNEAGTDAKFVGTHAYNIKKGTVSSAPSSSSISQRPTRPGTTPPSNTNNTDPDLPQQPGNTPSSPPPANNWPTANPSPGLNTNTGSTTSSSSSSQPIGLGKIQNSYGTGISGAKVKINNQKITTNSNGTYTPSSTYGKIKVRSKGYALHKSKVNSTSDLDITLYKKTKFHIGFGFGLDMGVKPLAATETITYGGLVFSSKRKDISPFGIGFKLEMPIHPIMRRNLHWGFLLDYGWGRGIGNDEGTASGTTQFSYKHSRIGVAMELAIGARKFKFLGKYRIGSHRHNFSKIENSAATITETDMTDHFKSESITGGFRLFSPLNKYNGRAATLDIYAFFTRDAIWANADLLTTEWFGGWQKGGGITIWAPGRIKIDCQVAMVEDYISTNYGSGFLDKTRIYTQVSILYNLNLLAR